MYLSVLSLPHNLSSTAKWLFLTLTWQNISLVYCCRERMDYGVLIGITSSGWVHSQHMLIPRFNILFDTVCTLKDSATTISWNKHKALILDMASRWGTRLENADIVSILQVRSVIHPPITAPRRMTHSTIASSYSSVSIVQWWLNEVPLNELIDLAAHDCVVLLTLKLF
jgi:hypothetical protein